MFNRETDFVGKGEMGTAVRAFKHGNLEMPVVLKIIRQSKLTDPMRNKWMKREISVHSQLTENLGIVKLYEVLDNAKYLVMVLEYCKLGSI